MDSFFKSNLSLVTALIVVNNCLTLLHHKLAKIFYNFFTKFFDTLISKHQPFLVSSNIFYSEFVMYSKKKVEPFLTDVSSHLSAESTSKQKSYFDSAPQSRKTSIDNDRSAPSKNASKASFFSPFIKEPQSSRASITAGKTSRSPGSRKSTLKARGVMTDSLSVPLNKMSLKLYGSKKAVQAEQQRLERAGSWIIHPYSNFRLLWDCSTLLLLLVNITLIPVAITFWKIDQPSWLPFKVRAY